MTAKLTGDASQEQGVANALKDWVMVALTLAFVLLYGVALVGWLKPLADERMMTRLEPVVLIIIGYYLGRLPAQSNEKTLKDELNRQTQKADAIQHAKEQTQQVREGLEEKVKNVKAALASIAPNTPARNMVEHLSNTAGLVKEEALRRSVIAALSILNS
jgi:predicted Co/Zn/Cd cation transporter (cation efflux family)